MRLATTCFPLCALSLMLGFAGARAGTPDDTVALDRDGNPYVEASGGSSPTGGGAPATGTLTVFTDRAAFLAAAGSAVTETFEGYAHTADCDTGALPVMVLDDFTATSSPAALKLLREPCFGNHNTTPGGQKYLGADTDVAEVSADVLFVFNGFLTAVGMDLVDLDVATLAVTVAGGTYPVPPNGDGGASFFGIVSDAPFGTVSFHVATDVDTHYSFDDVAYVFGGPVDVEGKSFGRVKSEYR